MTEKGFFRENAVPIAFTIIVVFVGTYLLYQQGYFAKAGMGGSAAFKNMQLKIVLEEGGVALVGYVPPEYLMDYMTFAGNPSPGPGSMVLGFVEGGIMAEEDNLSFNDIVWGFEADEEFLGGEVKVTGILAKTDMLIDMLHIVPKDAFDRVSAQKIDIKFTEEGMPKFFYYIDAEGSDWPGNLTFAEGSREGFSAITRNGKRYMPLVLGSEEAKMMRKESIFKKVGDRIEGLFGKDVYIAGILAPTNSSLDMLHYMPA